MNSIIYPIITYQKTTVVYDANAYIPKLFWHDKDQGSWTVLINNAPEFFTWLESQIAPVRELQLRTGLTYALENVPGQRERRGEIPLSLAQYQQQLLLLPREGAATALRNSRPGFRMGSKIDEQQIFVKFCMLILTTNWDVTGKFLVNIIPFHKKYWSP